MKSVLLVGANGQWARTYWLEALLAEWARGEITKLTLADVSQEEPASLNGRINGDTARAIECVAWPELLKRFDAGEEPFHMVILSVPHSVHVACGLAAIVFDLVQENGLLLTEKPATEDKAEAEMLPRLFERLTERLGRSVAFGVVDHYFTRITVLQEDAVE